MFRTFQAVNNNVQVALLQHALKLTRPQALCILTLTQLLQRCDLVLVSLHHDRLDLECAIRVGIFQSLLHGIRLNQSKSRVARANVDGRELRAGRGVQALWRGLRRRLEI
jgi:hypothetical protein